MAAFTVKKRELNGLVLWLLLSPNGETMYTYGSKLKDKAISEAVRLNKQLRAFKNNVLPIPNTRGTHKCEHCLRKFTPHRADQIFCSKGCARIGWYYKNRKTENPRKHPPTP